MSSTLKVGDITYKCNYVRIRTNKGYISIDEYSVILESGVEAFCGEDFEKYIGPVVLTCAELFTLIKNAQNK